jgi:aminoglycoside 6'-N-acetyltransferase I
MSLFVMPYRAWGVPLATVVPGDRALAGDGAMPATDRRDPDPASAAPPRVRIRPVRRADNESWVALRCARWPRRPATELWLDIERWWWTGDSCTQCLVAEEGRRLVGFLELSIRSGADSGLARIARVDGWYVAPEARRLGVGRALLQAAEAWAGHNRCGALESEGEWLDLAAQRAYAAAGYSATATIVRFHKVIASSRHPEVSEADPFGSTPPGAR